MVVGEGGFSPFIGPRALICDLSADMPSADKIGG